LRKAWIFLPRSLRDLIAVALCAFDNDNGSVKMDHRGIGRVLEMVVKMASDLIDQCEMMEKNKS